MDTMAISDEQHIRIDLGTIMVDASETGHAPDVRVLRPPSGGRLHTSPSGRVHAHDLKCLRQGTRKWSW